MYFVGQEQAQTRIRVKRYEKGNKNLQEKTPT